MWSDLYIIMHILVRALEEHPGVAGLPSTEDCGSALTKAKSEKEKVCGSVSPASGHVSSII